MINLLPAAQFLYTHGEGIHSGIDLPDIEEDISNMFRLEGKLNRHTTYQEELFWLPDNQYSFQACWDDGIWSLTVKKVSGQVAIPAWGLQRCA
jgi:hypothetical protein